MSELLPQSILVVDSDEQSIDHISSGLKEKDIWLSPRLMDMMAM